MISLQNHTWSKLMISFNLHSLVDKAVSIIAEASKLNQSLTELQ